MNNIIKISLAFLILLSGTNIYADGTKGKAKKDSKKSTTIIVFEKIEGAFDTELSLESWMTEIKEFTLNETFYEEELLLESWMMKEFAIDSEAFIDSEPELEYWMINIIAFNEGELVLEDWMMKSFNTQDTFSEEELQLESWMFDFTK